MIGTHDSLTDFNMDCSEFGKDQKPGSEEPKGRKMMENGNAVFRQVRVTPEHGLHLSPISQLVRKALTFSSSISLKFDDRKADVKSAFDLMLLAAPSGAILDLEVSGVDAEVAAESICELFEAGFVISGSEIH